MSWLRGMLADRRILLSLVSNDLRARYLTNYLGFLWVLIQPCATTLILWFVFQFGFKAAPHGDFPFVLWLVCGLVPWFFTVEALNSGCTAVKENSFLVKKIVFKVSLLPLVNHLGCTRSRVLCVHSPAVVRHLWLRTEPLLVAGWLLHRMPVHVVARDCLDYQFGGDLLSRSESIGEHGHTVRFLADPGVLGH